MHFLILPFTWPVSNRLNPNVALAAESLDTSDIDDLLRTWKNNVKDTKKKYKL